MNFAFPRRTRARLPAVIRALLLLSLVPLALSTACATKKRAQKPNREAELNAMVDDSLDTIPAFPSDEDVDRANDLARVKRQLIGCKTKDGLLLACPGVLAWIYDGDRHALEEQKLGAFGDLSTATKEVSRDRQFHQVWATFDGVKHLVVTKRSPPRATVACQISEPMGEHLCTTLLSATARHGRAAVGRAVAGNLDLVSADVDTPSDCRRKDRPGHVEIQCNAITLAFGRTKKNTSEIGMRVLLANLADRFESDARNEGATTKRTATIRCLVDGKEGECTTVQATLGAYSQATTFAVGFRNKVYARCAVQGAAPDDPLPSVCTKIIADAPPR